MNVFRYELRTQRKSILLWGASLSLLAAFFLSIYPSFAQETDVITTVFRRMPQAVTDALGLFPEAFDNVLGFYTFVMTFLVLCAAVQAMNVGLGVLAKEAAGKTADFLLTKPVSRAAVLTAKLLAALTALGITFLVFLAASGVITAAVSNGPLDWGLFLMISLPVFIVQVIFAALGFAVAAIARKIKSVLPLSLSTVFAFFVIGLVQGALKDQNLRYLTPFKYFDYVDILKRSAYEGRFLALSAAIVAVAVTVSYLVFTRKDIHAA